MAVVIGLIIGVLPGLGTMLGMSAVITSCLRHGPVCGAAIPGIRWLCRHDGWFHLKYVLEPEDIVGPVVFLLTDA